MKVVCDSSVLIGLSKIGKIEILKNIFGIIYQVRHKKRK